MKKQLLIVGVMLILIIVGLSGCTDKEDGIFSGLGYINEEWGFGLNPPEGWSVEYESSAYVIFVKSLDDNITRNMTFAILAFKLDENKTIRSLYESTLENLNNFSDATLISNKERTVNGREAYEIVAMKIKQNIQTEQKTILIEVNKNLLLIINYEGPLDLHDLYDPVIEQSINSLVIDENHNYASDV